MAEEPSYSIELFEGYWEALEALPASQQTIVTDFVAHHLTKQPRAVAPGGKHKRLKGTWSHTWQFECGSNRLLYEIDEDRKTVLIPTLGSIPTGPSEGRIAE